MEGISYCIIIIRGHTMTYYRKTYSCRICLRPDVQEINEAIIAGDPVTEIARRCQVSDNAISKHRRECIDKNLITPNEKVKFSKFNMSKDLPRCRFCKTLCANFETLQIHQKFCRGEEGTHRQASGALVRGRTRV